MQEKGEIMALKRISKIAALAMAAVMVSEAGLTSFVPLTAEAKEKEENVIAEAVNAASSSDNFTWDNATVYFAITDRFYNGDTSNDHSYGRSTTEKGAENYETRQGTFHGGDLKGMTQKIKEGYFDDLGVNAIWITAPYEQIHGGLCGDGFKSYAYHGYWTLDFSNMDANMGTEADMKEFVDTAHEHGIRVVVDIVMNHVGYVDAYTADEYGFGSLASNWKDIYYNWDETQYKWYNDYAGEAANNGSQGMLNYEGNWASTWWGPSWVRAVQTRFSGYDGTESGSDYTLCTSGLPDIKTENTSDNGIPPILKTKWTKEGRYDQETKELDEFFTKSGLPRKNVNYVVKWLTDYVREYGIDGFRCDTAKHIETEHWATLKQQSQIALQEWRKNNPDNVAASWDEDFWMTGEVYGWSGGKDQYFTTGKFDSLINFGFQGKENQSGASLEGTYSSYAGSINSDPDYNMLTYISSHDKGLGARSANAGTALLLCPGAVQIYYGDETGRTGAGYANAEQGWRSQMNWSSINTGIQSNWQKIGKFRKNHASVGAGQHKQISTSPYTFSRTYHLGQDDEDKVVVSLPGSAGTHNVSVGNIFEDGETVTDAYSGESYTVSGGQVSATCDSNGVILLEGSGEIKPSVGANITGGTYTGTTYSSETIQVKLSANKVKNATYAINDGAETAYNADDVITLGGGAAYGEKTVLVLKGESEDDGSEVTKVLNYTKCSEPSISAGAAIKVSKSEFATAPYCYAYDTAKKELNGAWPGAAMKDDGDYWSYTPNDMDSFIMILSDGNGWRSTADQQPGLTVNGAQLYTKSTGNLTTLPVGEAAKVTVKYVDEAGNDLLGGLDVYRVGAVGDSYTTSARIIKGYTIKEVPLNATGKFTADEITVTYVYSGGAVITNPPTPTEGGKVTNTPTPTEGGEVTNTPTPTEGGEVTNTPAPTNTTVPTGPVDVTDTPDPTTVPTEFVLDGFTAVKTQSGIRLIANASGGNGDIRYMFSYEKDGKEILIANFQSESQYIWTPSATGTYTLNVYAINCGTILDKTIATYTVR